LHLACKNNNDEIVSILMIDYDFTYVPWYGLSSWVQEKEKTQSIHNAKENDIDNNFRTFTFEKTSSSIIFHGEFSYKLPIKS
jgi:hypothetical protein